MPIEPALQIPNTAKPVCWPHNLAFNNSIANVSTSDGSNSLIIGTGDGAVNFKTGATKNPWVGFRYLAPDGVTQCGIVAPLTTAHGLALLSAAGAQSLHSPQLRDGGGIQHIGHDQHAVKVELEALAGVHRRRNAAWRRGGAA